MFKKKSSFRGNKGHDSSARNATSAYANPTVATPPTVVEEPRQPQPPKKVEVAKPKPTLPASIVPAGTKKVLVVGKFVVMTADVKNCDAVIVQGNLDGNIKAKYVVIMKGGCMRGKVECDEADVAGSFEGVEMIARHRLTLSSTARVGGKTTYHRLSVHDGAILTGDLLYKPTLPDPVPSVPTAAEDQEEGVEEEEASAEDSGETSAGEGPTDEDDDGAPTATDQIEDAGHSSKQ